MIKLVIDKDGVAREYDDTYDITIHCESLRERERVWQLLDNLQQICNINASNYIDREEAIHATWNAINVKDACEELRNLPYVAINISKEDVPEIRYENIIVDKQEPMRIKGHWNITDAYPHNVHCSVCYKKFAQTHWEVWKDGSLPRNFCPNCGADMREEQNGKSERQI